jgi:hypothetical protein
MTEETGVDRWEMKLIILSHKGYEKVNKSTNMNRTKNYASPQLNYWIQKRSLRPIVLEMEVLS